MREIKFRAWDEGNKVMHYNFQWMQSGNNGNDWICFMSEKRIFIADVIKDPFFSQQLKKMQYTGLKDKNGKEIYEGDIVKDSEKVHEVYFGECSWDEYAGIGWILKMLPETDETNFWLSPEDSSVIEIIGNIYQNPELLKSWN